MLQTDLMPADVPGSNALLVALHGLCDSMEGYRWIPRMLHIPELNYLLVNAPDAYYGGFSWYDFAADPGPGVRRSYKLLERLLDDLREQGYPTEKTVLFGFSQGCLMTIETGIRYPHKFAGLVGVSGYVFEPENLISCASPAARQQRFLITHGSEDALIPIQSVRPQIDQLKAAGIQIDWREFEKDHSMMEPEIAQIRDFVLASLRRAELESS
jgi:phospholipase/carboxylesterase